MSESSICDRSGHRFFVADVVLVPSEGKAVVLALCTSCGRPLEHPHVVSKPHSNIDLASIQKKKLEKGV